MSTESVGESADNFKCGVPEYCKCIRLCGKFSMWVSTYKHDLFVLNALFNGVFKCQDMASMTRELMSFIFVTRHNTLIKRVAYMDIVV